MESQPHIRCPNCKYDLHGLLAADRVMCPECGTEHDLIALCGGLRRRFLFGYVLLAFSPPLIAVLLFLLQYWFSFPTEVNNDSWISTVLGMILLVLYVALPYIAAYALISGNRSWRENTLNRAVGAFFLAIGLSFINILTTALFLYLGVNAGWIGFHM